MTVQKINRRHIHWQLHIVLVFLTCGIWLAFLIVILPFYLLTETPFYLYTCGHCGTSSN